jgi:cell wall-associated NlpC family hydrolase
MSFNGNIKSEYVLHGKLNRLYELRGYSAYEIAVINGYKGTEQEWIESRNGYSAYEIAVNNGFVGTEQDWLKTLESPNSFTKDNPPDSGDIATLSVNHPKFVDEMIRVAKSYYIADAQYFKANKRHLFNYHQYYTCFNEDFGYQETTPYVWPDNSKPAAERRRYKKPIANYNFLDCSAFMNLVLRGIPYEKSPYALLPEQRKNWDRYSIGDNKKEYPWATNPFDWRSSRTDLIQYWTAGNFTTKTLPSSVNPGEYVTVHETDVNEQITYYNNRLAPRGADNLGKLLARQNGRVEYTSDYSNVEPGDIVFYSPVGSEGYGDLNHVALVVSKEPVMETDADYERFKKYPYKHRLMDSSTKSQYNTFGDEPDVPTFIQCIPIEDANGNVVDVVSERYLETATSRLIIVRPNLAYTYGNVTAIQDGGTGAATKDAARCNLGIPGKHNVLHNSVWARKEYIIDQQNGYIVPPGTVAYTDSSLTTVVGNPLSVYRVVNELTETHCRWTVSGVNYYAPASVAVRGYKRSGYMVDRWRSGGSNDVCLIKENGVGFVNVSSSSSYFRQYFDFLPAGTYTLSVLTEEITGEGATVYCANTNGNAPWGVLTLKPGLSTRQITIDEGACNRVQIALQANSTVTISAIKLERGNVQTLAHEENGKWVLDDIPDTYCEINKCKRYYERITAPGSTLTLGVGTAANSSEAYVSVKLEPKVSIPSFVNPDNVRYGDSTLKNTPTEVSVYAMDINSGICTLKLSGTFIAGEAYRVGLAADSYVAFDSNL